VTPLGLDELDAHLNMALRTGVLDFVWAQVVQECRERTALRYVSGVEEKAGADLGKVLIV
jgi:hypothetical protein